MKRLPKINDIYQIKDKQSDDYNCFCRVLEIVDEKLFKYFIAISDKNNIVNSFHTVSKKFFDNNCKYIGTAKYNAQCFFENCKNKIKDIKIDDIYLVNSSDSIYVNSVLRICKIDKDKNEVHCLISFNNSRIVDDFVVTNKDYINRYCTYLGKAINKINNIFDFGV